MTRTTLLATAGLLSLVSGTPAAAATPDPIAIAQEHLEAGRTEAAIWTMRHAIERQPKNAAFHAKLGYVYRYAGLTDRSIAAYRTSEALDPSPRTIVTDEGQIAKAQIHAGDYAGAAASRARVSQVARDNGLAIDEKMHFYDGVEALFEGHSDGAIQAFDASAAVGADTIWAQFAHAYRNLARGDKAATLADAKRLERLDDTHDGERHYRIVHLYAGVGDNAAALKTLAAAIDTGFYNANAMEHDPSLAGLRGDPAFKALVAKARARMAATERAAAAPPVTLHFTLAIHGGGGVRPKNEMTPQLEAAYRGDLAKSLQAGQAMLKAGGTGIDAIEAAINVMEDSPLFNAGKGASYNRDGFQEFDTSIMEGGTHLAGSAGVVQFVKNPISLARRIMERSPHVMLAGQGALDFAKAQGMNIEPAHYFFTQRKWDSLQDRLRLGTRYGKTNETDSVDAADKETAAAEGGLDWRAFGTVGSVALDGWGNLAAGTSTGGREGKLPGRVGDSAIIGAGTYADNATLAVSSTGLGEYVMRLAYTKNMADRMQYSGWSLAKATQDGIDQIVALGGSTGVVAIDRKGGVAMPYTGHGMYRGVVRDDGQPDVMIYDK